MFGDIETEKNTFYHDKSPVPLRHIDTEKVLVSNLTRFLLVKKTISTFLITCIMIIKSSYIYCFLKQALM